jgi:sulfite exporter TauE/SafE
MPWQFIIAGFTLGLVSSLHCVGMCGPLALSLPVHHLPKPARFFSLLFYQIGRVVSYSFLGLVLGMAGRSIYLAGFQHRFSIVMGIIILLLFVLYYGYHYALQPSFLKKVFHYLQQVILRILQSDKNIASFMLLGMANGLLPCGMVYVAVATAVTASAVNDSILFMTLFGIGTIPAMLMLSYFGQMISLPVRKNLRKAVPFFILIMGVLLILRGMNLGIPYISPALPVAGADAINCHS